MLAFEPGRWRAQHWSREAPHSAGVEVDLGTVVSTPPKILNKP